MNLEEVIALLAVVITCPVCKQMGEISAGPPPPGMAPMLPYPCPSCSPARKLRLLVGESDDREPGGGKDGGEEPGMTKRELIRRYAHVRGPFRRKGDLAFYFRQERQDIAFNFVNMLSYPFTSGQMATTWPKIFESAYVLADQWLEAGLDIEFDERQDVLEAEREIGIGRRKRKARQ